MASLYTSRQDGVHAWNAEAVNEAKALVLGAGGIGCNVALTLCRLGIKQLIIMDFDDVDESNLNRQVLFRKEDVGCRKVEAAARGLREGGHAYQTEVIGEHVDCVRNWAAVVAAAKNSTVIFNGVDVGAAFDVAVGSLAAALAIPYVAGSSYAHTWIVDFFRPPRADIPAEEGTSRPCVQCAGALGRDDPALPHLHVSKILEHASLEEFVKNDAKPETAAIGSYGITCGMCSQFAVNSWLHGCLSSPETGYVSQTWTKYDLLDPAGIVQFSVERDTECPICSAKEA